VSLLTWTVTAPTCDPNVADSGTGQWDAANVNPDYWECSNEGAQFFECAIDLTSLGILPENQCSSLQQVGAVVTRSSGAINAQLQDAVVFGQTNISNCGELQITKETDPVIAPSAAEIYEFGYLVAQRDGKPVYDADQTGTGDPTGDVPPPLPPDPANWTLLNGTLSLPNIDPQDFWSDIISQSDYDILESNLPPDSPWSFDSINCTYSDIYDPNFDPANGGTPRKTVTITSIFNPPENVFLVVPNPFFGSPIQPTECVILNTSSTVPITLAWFSAMPAADGGVQFDWATSIEAGNIGFNLYERDEEGDWRRVNDGLIATQTTWSTTTQTYSYTALGVAGTEFMIADVDMRGRERRHGPFQLGEDSGARFLGGPEIDWDGIRAEHEAKKQLREKGQKRELKEKVKKLKQEKLKRENEAKPQKGHGFRSGWLGRATDRVVAGLLAAVSGTAHAAEPPMTDLGLMQLHVEEAGVQRITYEQLLEEGLDLAGLDPAAISLTNRGDPVPIFVGAPESATTDASSLPRGKPKKDSSTAQVDLQSAASELGPGSYVEFIGEGIDSLYTRANVYVLDVNPALAARPVDDAGKAHKRSKPAAYYMHTTAVEPEVRYHASAPNGDPWIAQELRAYPGKPVTAALDLQVDHLVQKGAPAPTIEVGLWGGVDFPASDDHHVTVSLNGTTELADIRFDGITDYLIDAEASGLVEGTNTLSVEVPGDTGNEADYIEIDRWSVTYPRDFVAIGGALTFKSAGDLFEVRGLDSADVSVYRQRADGSVQRLTNVTVYDEGSSGFTAAFAGGQQESTYYVATATSAGSPALETPPVYKDITSDDAEYLVIADPGLITPPADWDGPAPIDKLVDLREAQFGSVKVVTTDQIKAQFGFGIFGAEAIQAYIRYAAENLGTTTVHLIGGDTYDYRGDLTDTRARAISFVPSLYVATHPMVSLAPSDAKYADLNDDDVPDLVIGRTLARRHGDLANLVDKTVAFEERFTEGFYTDPRASVFSADKQDGMYSFKADAESMISALPETWQQGQDGGSLVQTVYLDDYLDGETGLDVEAARNDLFAAINGGVALTSLVGHSSHLQFTFSDLLFASDFGDEVTNYGLPTVITQWGCWNAYYVSPYEDTLAHWALLINGKGAAAVLGASSLSSARNERALSLEFYPRMVEPGKTIGQALLEAKRELAEDGGSAYVDVVLGWNYFGDPALIMEPKQ
jgi:hypothetical protein